MGNVSPKQDTSRKPPREDLTADSIDELRRKAGCLDGIITALNIDILEAKANMWPASSAVGILKERDRHIEELKALEVKITAYTAKENKLPEHDPQPVKAVQYDYSGHIKGLNSDRVNAPSHYTSHPSGVECIDITEHYDFCVGNAIKYLWRAGLKAEAGLTDKAKEIEDLKKAAYYINRKIKQLEK